MTTNEPATYTVHASWDGKNICNGSYAGVKTAPRIDGRINSGITCQSCRYMLNNPEPQGQTTSEEAWL